MVGTWGVLGVDHIQCAETLEAYRRAVEVSFLFFFVSR
jgi:hypothetical protein